MAYFLQLILNAVPLAALYAALAFGYALLFGMTRRVDIAYGALFAFAGQVFALGYDAGWNHYFLILPAALALGFGLSMLYTLGTGLWLARFVALPLAARSPNTLVVAGLGVVLVLSETMRLASDTRDIWVSPFLNARVALFTVEGEATVGLTNIQILNSLLLVGLVWGGSVFLARSRFGRNWRAVADDPLAARLTGVESRRIFLWSAGLAAFTAALCGILATAYYGSMNFGSGLIFGVKVALIAAAGGQGHPARAAAGGALVAIAETLWSGYGPILWRDFVLIGALVLLLVLTRRERTIP